MHVWHQAEIAPCQISAGHFLFTSCALLHTSYNSNTLYRCVGIVWYSLVMGIVLSETYYKQGMCPCWTCKVSWFYFFCCNFSSVYYRIVDKLLRCSRDLIEAPVVTVKQCHTGKLFQECHYLSSYSWGFFFLVCVVPFISIIIIIVVLLLLFCHIFWEFFIGKNWYI